MEPTEASLHKDLEIQWRDHHHMRDQTWKTVTNTLLLFVGAVGLEVKDTGKVVLMITYAVVVIVAVSGGLVARHHRRRQRQKFEIIKIIERRLALYDVKAAVLQETKPRWWQFTARIFTAKFIEWVEFGVALIALVLFVRKCLAPA